MNRIAILRGFVSVFRYTAVRALLVAALVSPLLIGAGVMLSGDYERAKGSLVPIYLGDDGELMRKHLYTMAPSLEFIADRYGAGEFENLYEFTRAENVLAPIAAHMRKNGLTTAGHMAATRDLNDYKNSLDAGELLVSDRIAGELFATFLRKKYATKGEELLAAIRSSNDVPDWMVEDFPDQATRMRVLDSLDGISLAVMNHELNASYVSYNEVPRPANSPMRESRWLPIRSPEWDLWADFVRGLPGQYKWLVTKEVRWRSFLRRSYGNEIAQLNRAWGTAYKGFSQVPWRVGKRGGDSALSDWRRFVHREWPRSMIELPEGYDQEWRDFLGRRFAGGGGMLGMAVEGSEGDEIALPRTRPSYGETDVLWCDFVESGVIPAEEIALITHAERFGPFLRSNYLAGSIVSLNEEWGTSFEEFTDVPLPLGLSDLSLFPAQSEDLRKEYAADAWFDAVTSLRYPFGILQRTLLSVGVMTFCSVLLSVIISYLLARLPVRYASRWIVWCAVASAIPVTGWLAAGRADVEGVLGPGQMPTLAATAVTLLSSLFLRRWFFAIVRDYREPACLDGVGEIGFLFRFVARYSWPAVIYAIVLHFLCIYSAVDWQVLAMGRLWDWTLGGWALNHASSGPSLKVAVAMLGMLPVFFVVAVSYPVLTRYSLVPVLRRD